MPRRDLRILLALCALSLGWLLVQSVAGAGDSVAILAPALLVFVPLLFGRYVGEETLARLRGAGGRPVRRLRQGVARAHQRAPRSISLRGTVLGTRSGERAPPHLGLALTS